MNKWYEKSGEQSDVVISTRIRLARNIEKYPFQYKLNQSMRNKVIEDVKNALSDEFFNIYNFEYLNTQNMSKINLRSLMERHLLSPEFVRQSDFKAFFLSESNNVSIMINEEDHIRLQVMKEGLDLNSTYDIADNIESKLDEILKFAFNSQLGYLTQCPTNLGTGMRASVMLHLPALRRYEMIDKIASNLIKLGLTMRGIYGEGTEPKGDIYQISNQVTLGISEKTAIKNLYDITVQIIEQEKSCRQELLKNIQITDEICRSLGILKTAKILNNDEFMKLISNIRFGISIGLIRGISYDNINALIIKSQPYVMMKEEGNELSSIQRDKKRAKISNEILENAKIV